MQSESAAGFAPEMLFAQGSMPFMAMHPLEALQGVFRRAPMRRPQAVVEEPAAPPSSPAAPVPQPRAEPRRRIPLARDAEPTPQIRSERLQKMEEFINRY